MKSMSKKLQILLVLSIATLIALPIFAGGPLNLNFNDSENFERWPNGGLAIPFNPDGIPAGGPGALALGPLTYADAVTLVEDAFQVWEDVPTATATYTNNGPLATDIDVTNFLPLVQNLFFGTNTSDGVSPIVFDEDGSIFISLFGVSGVLGFASPDTFDASGVPIEGVSFLNGGQIGPSFPLSEFFSVMVHEYGHYSGMAHTVTNGQNIALGDTSGPSPNNTYGNAPGNQVETMYPFAIVGGGQDSVHIDELGFYSTLYPAASVDSVYGIISGKIYAPDGVTPLTGVNVIAREVSNPFVAASSAISGDRGVTGEYSIRVPPGSYTIHVDQILQGGFSTPGIALPSEEEFYNGANESTDPTIDDPTVSTQVVVTAGTTVSGIDIFFNGVAPGEIDLGDDDTEEIPLPFEFTLCGQTFTSVFVNSNGNLTFGTGDTDFSESVAEFLGEGPRVAGLWDDLAPNNGGTVSFSQTSNTFTVRYENVPEFSNTGANTFEITLRRASDHVEIDYENISSTDGLAGVTCGCAVTSGLEPETELVTVPNSRTINMNNSGAVYELFTGDNDLADYSLKFVNLNKPFNDDFEPNDSLGSATAITLPFNSQNDFTAIAPLGGDVDYYTFSADQNQTLIAELTNGCIDSVLGLFDAVGNQIAFDDDGGPGLLSRIVAPISTAGQYILAVSTFPDTDFTGDGGSAGRYVLDAFLVDGILLDLGDDTSESVALGFTFPFQGSSYTTAFVNSNGNITFGSGDTDFSESVSELLSDQPRIAGVWDDLSPNNGGQVIFEGDATSATVSFIGVPEFISTGSNTFAITMRSDGSVTIAYGAVSAGDGIAGVSPGGGAADPGETDLSAAASLSVTGVTYEQFTGDNDLSGLTLDFNP